MSRRLLPPVRGAADFGTSQDTPPDICPPHAIRNVRMRTGPALRGRPGKRPGLAKRFLNAIGGGRPVQLLDVIAKAAGTVYSLGNTQTMGGGSSSEAGTLAGQAWFLDANRSMFRSFEDPNPTADTPNPGAFCCDWHPDGSAAAIVTIVIKDYGGGTKRAVSQVNYYDPDADTLLWHTQIEDKDPGGSVPGDPRHLLANSVRVYPVFTYVSVGPYVYVLRTADGVYLKRYSFQNIAWEVMDTRVRPDNTLAALYWGNPAISGVVPADDFSQGSYFRSGIALFNVVADTTVSGNPLVQRQFGVKKTNAYAYYENHIDFRFSEHSIASPRGCMPQGFGLGLDGSVVIGRTNQGFGPTSSFPPSSAGSSASPPITVCKVSGGTTSAEMLWEVDTNSIQSNWLTSGWYNDIGVGAAGAPIGTPPAGPEQSIMAIAVSPTNGDVYAAGKRANGFSVHGLRGTDGTRKWSTDLGGTVYQHCIAVDPVTGLIVVCGERNDDWIDPETDTPSNVDAHVWWLDPDSGEVRFHFDLSEDFATNGVDNCSAFSVAVSNTGRTLYTTVHIG